MKVLKLLVIVGLIAGIGICASAQEVVRNATIIEVVGKAGVRTTTSKTWEAAEPGKVLSEGDVVRTQGDSLVVLQLDEGGERATVDMSENTQLGILELSKNQEKKSTKTLLDLAVGKILIQVDKLRKEKSKFEIKTPTSIVGVRGTTFAVEVQNLE